MVGLDPFSGVHVCRWTTQRNKKKSNDGDGWDARLGKLSCGVGLNRAYMLRNSRTQILAGCWVLVFKTEDFCICARFISPIFGLVKELRKGMLVQILSHFFCATSFRGVVMSKVLL